MFIIEMSVLQIQKKITTVGASPHGTALSTYNCAISLKCSAMIIDQDIGKQSAFLILIGNTNTETFDPVVENARL